jgi:hypothetical protein
LKPEDLNALEGDPEHDIMREQISDAKRSFILLPNDQTQPAAERNSAMGQGAAAAWLRCSCSSWVLGFMDEGESIMVAVQRAILF